MRNLSRDSNLGLRFFPLGHFGFAAASTRLE